MGWLDETQKKYGVQSSSNSSSKSSSGSGWLSQVQSTGSFKSTFQQKQTQQPTPTPKPQPQQNIFQKVQQTASNVVSTVQKGIQSLTQKQQPKPITLTKFTQPPIKQTLQDSFMKFPSIFDSPTKIAGQSAQMDNSTIDKIKLNYHVNFVDNVIKGVGDLLTYHPKALQALADAQNTTERIFNLPVVKDSITPVLQGVVAGVNLSFLGSGKQIQATFNKPLPKDTPLVTRGLDTVGRVIGTALSFLAGGEVLKAAQFGRATLPVLFGTMGQLSDDDKTTITQRIAQIPADVVAGYLFSEVPAFDGFTKQSLKSIAGVGAINSAQTFIDSLIKGMKPEQAAKSAGAAALVAGLFHVAGSATGLLSDEILSAKKSQSDTFSSDAVRAVAKNTKDPELAKRLNDLADQADAKGQDVKIDINAVKSNMLGKIINPKKAQGFQIKADFVDKTPVDETSAQLGVAGEKPAGGVTTEPSFSSSSKEASLPVAGREEPSGLTTRTSGVSKSTQNVVSPSRTNFLSTFDMNNPSPEDYTKYYGQIQAAKPEFDQKIKAIADEVGGEVISRIKSQESLSTKLGRKEGRVLGDMNDTIAGTVITDNIDKAVESAKKQGIVISTDYRQTPTFLGYKGVHGDLELSNGLKTEVQFNTAEGYAQKVEAHKIYDKWRKYIEYNGETTINDVLGRLKPEEKTAFLQDVQKSIDIYKGLKGQKQDTKQVIPIEKTLSTFDFTSNGKSVQVKVEPLATGTPSQARKFTVTQGGQGSKIVYPDQTTETPLQTAKALAQRILGSGAAETTQSLKEALKALSSPTGQKGYVAPEEFSKAAKEKINDVQDYLKQVQKAMDVSTNLDDNMYKLKTNSIADMIRARKVLEKVKIPVKDLENIFHYVENPRGETLTPEQQKIYEQYIKPIKEVNANLYNKLKKDGWPVAKEEYLTRFVKSKANVLSRLEQGRESIQQGGTLGKTAGFMKKRVMKALVDEQGNRKVVAIKKQKISEFTDKKPNFIGNLNLKTNEQLLAKELAPVDNKIKSLTKEVNILNATMGRAEAATQRILTIRKQLEALSEKRDEIMQKYNPNTLDNKVFVDKQGKTWKIKDATVKEIEAQTKVQYYKDPLASVLLSNLKLNQINRATEFLNAFKESPEFSKISVPIDSVDVPNGYRTTKLLNFRGYLFDAHVADTLDMFYDKMQGQGTDMLAGLSNINRFLRTAVLFNPSVHVFNIADHWLVNRGLSSFLNPKAYYRLMTTSARAISAVANQNQDYLTMLEHGAPMLSANSDNQNLYKMFLDKMASDIQTSPGKEYEAVAKALGYASPVAWVKAIYNFSSRVTWLSNDVLTMQAIYEEMANGKTIDEAIKDVGQHIPDYRLPSRILNSRILADVMRNPNISAFGSYHYGVLKSYGAMAKTLLGKGTSVKERAGVLDKLAMMALLGLFVYPMLDALAKKVTGSKKATAARRGASNIPNQIYKLTQGQEELTTLIQSIVTPAPGSKEALQLFFNLNFFTGQHIYDQSLITQDPKQFFGQVLNDVVQSVSPIYSLQRIGTQQITPKQFVQSLIGISNPKSTVSERRMQDLIYNQKSTYTTKIKTAMVNGDKATATSLMQEYNSRLLNDAKQAYKDNGKPVPPDKVLQKQLKTSLIFPPKGLAMRNFRKRQGKTFLEKITGQ